MNSSKHIATLWDVLDTEANAVVEQVKSEDIVGAHLKSEFVSNTRRKEATLALTFSGASLSQKVQIGCRMKESTPSISSSLRCCSSHHYKCHHPPTLLQMPALRASWEDPKLFFAPYAPEGHKVDIRSANHWVASAVIVKMLMPLPRGTVPSGI